MECEYAQKRLKAYVTDDLDSQDQREISDHLDSCEDCSHKLKQLTELSQLMHKWESQELPPQIFERIKSRLYQKESVLARTFSPIYLKKAALRLSEAAAVVILAFLFSLWLHNPPVKEPDYSATINLYLAEHQGAVLKNISQDSSARPMAQFSISRRDVLYFEQIDGFSRHSKPGVILKGPEEPFSPSAPKPSKIPTNDILTLSQARQFIDFEPAAPLRIHPGYVLDNIKKIENRNSLHLVYTNGIDTFSLFQQPLNGERGLAAKEFREFAIYQTLGPRSKEVGITDKITILAWSDGSLSLVLIGKMGVDQMMNIARSIPVVVQQNPEFQE